MLLICLGNLIGHWKKSLIVSFAGMVFWGGMIGLATPYNKGLMITLTFLEQTLFGWAQYESIAFTQLGKLCAALHSQRTLETDRTQVSNKSTLV